MVDPAVRSNFVIMSPLIDVVVEVRGGSLEFLEKWRPVLQPHHIIVIQNCPGTLRIPSGFDVATYSLDDAQRTLGDKCWCLAQEGGRLSRSYGYLMSKKRFIFTIGE